MTWIGMALIFVAGLLAGQMLMIGFNIIGFTIGAACLLGGVRVIRQHTIERIRVRYW